VEHFVLISPPCVRCGRVKHFVLIGSLWSIPAPQVAASKAAKASAASAGAASGSVVGVASGATAGDERSDELWEEEDEGEAVSSKKRKRGGRKYNR
jgi:hypothetical protein